MLHAGALEVAQGIEQQHAVKAGELRSSITAVTDQLRGSTSVLSASGAGSWPTRT